MAGRQALGMIEIRPLFCREEFQEAVRLQREIWGYAEIELLPVRLFVVATKIGGHVFGAFDGDSLIAFLSAIPGLKPGGKGYLHGHMLGVLPAYRNQGVGRLLKLRQREEAIAGGVELIEWTFDPLALKNAFFNIERLGAIVRRYVLNQYGTTTSHLHGGLPTDRCVAEWHVSTPRVARILAGGKPREQPVQRIRVPYALESWRVGEPSRARDEQQRISAQFLTYFRENLAVIGFERGDSAGAYLLGTWHSD